MSRLFRLICLWMMCVGAFSASSQDIANTFRKLSINDGLSQNTVYAILQDSKGFMWFGTKDGLNRYDGKHFKIYQNNPRDSTTIPDNYVHKLFEDRNGFIWIGTQNAGLLQFDRKTEQFLPITLQDDIGRTGAKDVNVQSILQDQNGCIWVGTNTSGLYCLEVLGFGDIVVRKHYSFSKNDPYHIDSNTILALHETADGTLWIGTTRGLSRLGKNEKSPVQFAIISKHKDAPADVLDNSVSCIHEGTNGKLWLGSLSGLVEFDMASKSYRLHPHKYEVNRYGWGRVKAIQEDNRGVLWLATAAGLLTFDRKSESFNYFTNEQENSASISFNIITCLEKDLSGLMWIGTAGMGINIFNPRFDQFQKYAGAPIPKSRTTGFSVYSILEENDSIVWIGCEVLYRWNKKSGVLRSYERSSKELLQFGNTPVCAMTKDSAGMLWFASTEGLFARNPLDGSTKLFQSRADRKDGLPEKKVLNFVQDRQGSTWAISSKHVSRLTNFEPGVFETFRIDSTDAEPTHSFMPALIDEADIMWIGSEQGLRKIHIKQGTNKLFTHDRNDLNSLSNNAVKSLCQDPFNPNYIWIGTLGGGLNRFDKTEETFKVYNEVDGLPNNVVYGILPDPNGTIWLSTNQGISRFDPTQESFTNYDEKDNLQSNEFNTGAYFKSPAGELYFGGIKGLNHFYPDSIIKNTTPPPVALTKLWIHNIEVKHKERESPLNHDISATELLYLAHDQNSIVIEFAALEFSAPDKNEFAYKLENFDTDWVAAGKSNRATFTNLSPGTYLFRVKAANNDGVWNETGATLKVVVASPWWSTWWAICVYALILLLVLYLIRNYEINRIRTRNQLKLEKVETETLRKIDMLKTKFFDNISHEFRTPLTLILGQLESMRLQSRSDEQTASKIQMAEANAQQLLALINQLMDISKIESDNAQVNLKVGDISAFLSLMCRSFEEMASAKGVNLSFHSRIAHVNVWFDEEKLRKIVSNLISNAIKFTPESGNVDIALHILSNDTIQICVKDSGIGIPKAQIPFIFDRFYQVDQSHSRAYRGTGIGLALVKELVELLNGNITVSSIKGVGTEFTVVLPFNIAEARKGIAKDPVHTDEEIHSYFSNVDARDSNHAEDVDPSGSDDKDRPSILLVEDNPDVRHFMADVLSELYQVHQAESGLDGIKIAQAEIPDLIVTDVMMPEMDGYSFVKCIREDQRSSHIPIVMVTGLDDKESKLKGFDVGVDAYIQKPFSVRELQLRIHKLIEQRKILRKKFGSLSGLDPKEISPHPADQNFMTKVIETVAEHFDDPSFGVDTLADMTHMSASQLTRKIKALINQTPGHLIREYRLQRAAELLLAERGNVSEVCFKTGFSDQAYFSRAFKKAYGTNPSKYHQS